MDYRKGKVARGDRRQRGIALISHGFHTCESDYVSKHTIPFDNTKTECRIERPPMRIHFPCEST